MDSRHTLFKTGLFLERLLVKSKFNNINFDRIESSGNKRQFNSQAAQIVLIKIENVSISRLK